MSVPSKWFVGVPRKLIMILGAIGETDVVFLDYLTPLQIRDEDAVPISVPVEYTNRTTGECYAVITPEMAGEHRFWPRIMDAAGAVVNIGEQVPKTIYTPGF